jgi:hypothetical protein
MKNFDISFSIYCFQRFILETMKTIKNREEHTSSSLGFKNQGSLFLPYNCGDSLQVV